MSNTFTYYGYRIVVGWILFFFFVIKYDWAQLFGISIVSSKNSNYWFPVNYVVLVSLKWIYQLKLSFLYSLEVLWIIKFPCEKRISLIDKQLKSIVKHEDLILHLYKRNISYPSSFSLHHHNYPSPLRKISHRKNPNAAATHPHPATTPTFILKMIQSLIVVLVEREPAPNHSIPRSPESPPKL